MSGESLPQRTKDLCIPHVFFAAAAFGVVRRISRLFECLRAIDPPIATTQNHLDCAALTQRAGQRFFLAKADQRPEQLLFVIAARHWSSSL